MKRLFLALCLFSGFLSLNATAAVSEGTQKAIHAANQYQYANAKDVFLESFASKHRSTLSAEDVVALAGTCYWAASKDRILKSFCWTQSKRLSASDIHSLAGQAYYASTKDEILTDFVW